MAWREQHFRFELDRWLENRFAGRNLGVGDEVEGVVTAILELDALGLAGPLVVCQHIGQHSLIPADRGVKIDQVF